MTTFRFRAVDLIKEVRKRPGLWDSSRTVDRIDKLNLWKEIGEAIFEDWNSLNKATAYDRVLQLQKKWRSLKDAYNRELRYKKRGLISNRREYVYYRKLLFLGGSEGLPEVEYKKDPFDESDDHGEEDQPDHDTTQGDQNISDDPLLSTAPKRRTKRKRRHQQHSDQKQEIEIPMFINEIHEQENDSDKLFLLSFYPEMKKLPAHIKMWTRAQIANIMQEAVTCHFNNTQPGINVEVPSRIDIKRPRHSCSE